MKKLLAGFFIFGALIFVSNFANACPNCDCGCNKGEECNCYKDANGNIFKSEIVNLAENEQKQILSEEPTVKCEKAKKKCHKFKKKEKCCKCNENCTEECKCSCHKKAKCHKPNKEISACAIDDLQKTKKKHKFWKHKKAECCE